MKLEGKALIAQGGGPTAVINQSLVGLVLEARTYPQIRNIYGSLGGVRGIINEDFVDLTQETTHNLEEVAQTPGSALFSTRDKPDSKYCQEIFKVLKAHDIRYLFYIGGNDSAETTRIVDSYAKQENFRFRAIHVPKTIDNDLPENDHTPGFGSAARFVANAFIGINQDNRSLPGVHICVVMGRDSGFLTAASVVARKYPDDGPHLIYVPERPFSLDEFLESVRVVYQRYGRCIVAVSEGIRDALGNVVSLQLGSPRERDAHGNLLLSGGLLGDLLAEEVKRKCDIRRVRADTIGYLQRSFFGCVSDVDQHEAREVGERAAQLAIWGAASGSITIQRTGDYSVDYQLVSLDLVAARTRTMPAHFLVPQGDNVTEDYLRYIMPLLGSGMRRAARLRAPHVAKILSK